MPPGYTFCGLRRTTLPGTSVNIDQRYHGSKHEVKGTSARWLLLAVNFGELRKGEVRRNRPVLPMPTTHPPLPADQDLFVSGLHRWISWALRVPCSSPEGPGDKGVPQAGLSTHSGAGVIWVSGCGPGPSRPVEVTVIDTRTFLSRSARVWHESLTCPRRFRLSSTSSSALVIFSGSPSRYSMRQVVHLA